MNLTFTFCALYLACDRPLAEAVVCAHSLVLVIGVKTLLGPVDITVLEHTIFQQGPIGPSQSRIIVA